jgi:putative PIN family toxin of toxin-antitoxin system
VFDTNVLISLFVFTDSQFAPLLGEVDAGRWIAYSSEACLAEYCRVVGYPIFGLAAERQREVTAAWQRRLTMAAASSLAEISLPRCKDRDDQKFLELARDAKAEWLVTADKVLLRLARRDKLRGVFEIITPEAALNRLGERATIDCS